MKTVRDTVTGPTFVSFNGIPIPIDSTPITPAYQAGEKVLDLEIFLSRYLIPAPFYIKLINDLAWWPITPFSPPPACPKVKTPASPPPPPRPPVSTAPDPNFVPNGIIGQNGGNPPLPRSILHSPTEEELFPNFFPPATQEEPLCGVR